MLCVASLKPVLVLKLSHPLGNMKHGSLDMESCGVVSTICPFGSSLLVVRDVGVGSTLITSVVCLADRPFVAWCQGHPAEGIGS